MKDLEFLPFIIISHKSGNYHQIIQYFTAFQLL